MKVYYLILSALISIIGLSCKLGPVDSNHEGVSPYSYSLTAEGDSIKCDVYIKSGTALSFGYNDIGVKVFIKGNEKDTGFVRLKPSRYVLGNPVISAPVPYKFYYDNTYKMFMGYICFTGASDSSSWRCNFNYSDVKFIDSVSLNVNPSSDKQQAHWDYTNGGETYYLTLIQTPYQYNYTFYCILHKTTDNINFYEVDSAYMGLKAYFEQTGEVYPNNIRPVSKGKGLYGAYFNLNKTGTWHVLDTVKRNDVTITNNPPPEFILKY